MARTLRLFVHVVERDAEGNTGRSGQFGPGDRLPGWAREAITNPDVWDGEADPVDIGEVQPEVERPSTAGPNSSREKWATYAFSRGVAVTDSMSRDQIIAAVDGD